MSRAAGESVQRSRGECLPARYPTEIDIVFRTAECGYFQPGGPPRTVVEACMKARELDRTFREQKHSIS